MFTISSAANPTVKMLKALHSKKGRAETGLFLAEGARLAQEAADLGIWPDIMAATPAALERPQTAALAERASQAGARVFATSARIMEQISRRENPQTIIGAYRQRWLDLDALAPCDLAVALEGVRDPGNLGTILRTCDAVGAGAAILIGACCDPFSIEAVRASMGSIFTTQVAHANLDSMNAWRRAHGFALIGASLKGRARHDEGDAARPTLLLLGNEQAGLTDEAAALCDALVKIPMRGAADSLNLAMATGVMLYDVWRRRGYAGARA